MAHWPLPTVLLLTLGLMTGPAPVAAQTGCVGVTVNPGGSLQTIFDAHPTGTTFCFQPGLYRLSMPAIPKSGSVLWAAPGAVLNGSIVSSFTQSGPYWASSGQTQEFTPPSTSPCADPAYTGCQRTEAVFRNGDPLWQVMSLAELGPGEFFFDYAADTVYLAEDPAGQTIEVTVAPAAIIGYGGTTGQQNVTVRGFVIEKFAADATNGYVAAIKPGWNWLIEANEVRLNSSRGVSVNNGVILRNNNLHHNGQYGFAGGPVTDLTVDNNDIGYNNTAGWDENWDAGGSKIIKSSRVVLSNNRVHDNKGPGLWTDWENFDITFEGNTVERNSGPGIFHEASAKAIIRNNTLRGNGTIAVGKSLWYGADLYLNDSKDTEIYGNTIVAGVHGIGLADTERGSTVYGKLEIRNVYVHHNTVTMCNGSFTGLVGRSTAFTSTANNRFRANTYYIPDPGNGRYWEWLGQRTRAEWRSFGHDKSGSFIGRAC